MLAHPLIDVCNIKHYHYCYPRRILSVCIQAGYSKSSCLELFCKEADLKYFTKFTPKHLCQRSFFEVFFSVFCATFQINFFKEHPWTFFYLQFLSLSTIPTCKHFLRLSFIKSTGILIMKGKLSYMLLN